MAKIRFRATAKADLVSIDDYSVKQFGDDTADIYMRGFRDAFQQLREHPLSGAEMPEFGKGYRCLKHRSHRIFYIIDGEFVVVVRILHHAMDAKRAMN